MEFNTAETIEPLKIDGTGITMLKQILLETKCVGDLLDLLFIV